MTQKRLEKSLDKNLKVEIKALSKAKLGQTNWKIYKLSINDVQLRSYEKTAPFDYRNTIDLDQSRQGLRKF
ncbi:hypothetical protein J2TS4_34010 [Paenibacillus sp. J2TS4]|nr:hypothetical protein J2TS4_34010 [Paenibacillus sp. J2TS4]